ncbi:DUF4097 family beta strand repeat-containing protein [Kribbella kalugense]|uniref:Putative adhesin n=1 Tax=Kribbella kalugense TaxID=2512221 RepID=A0A4R7ZK36_9ACTN|nr:DUF4097 family beta strand repeat-containing protein [Kribbella kalugense]TDW17812.1 putative adhesin [Kribbella kalugense]
MVERNISAETEGAVLLEALLHDRYGAVYVNVNPDCKVASVRVMTTDSEGVAAQAIADGKLTWDEEDRRLTVDIEAPGVNSRDGWRVDVWAELPPGSTLDAHTDEADVETSGEAPLADAMIETTTGEVRVEDAVKAYVKTVSGPVHVGFADEAVVRTEGDVAPDRDHVTIGEVGALDVQTTGGKVRVEHAIISLAVKTKDGDVEIDSTSSDGTDVRSQSGRITATVTGGKNHQFSSPTGVVDITVEYTAPPDVKIQASDIRGPVRPTLSEGFLEVNQHRPPSAAASGLGAGQAAGGGAAGGSAAAGAAATRAGERRAAIEC